MRRRVLIVLLLICVMGAGCRSSPSLAFQKGTSSDAEYIARVFSASIVVVAAIESDTFMHLTRQENADLQLRRLKVRVENVLRGDLVPGTTADYYYTWAGGSTAPDFSGFGT